VLRKAKAELEAEAAADHARQRERKACCAEQQAAEAQASANEATAQAEAARTRANTARRTRAARQRAEAAKGLALRKAQAAGQPIPDLQPQIDPQAMPSRNLPTNAAGEVKGKAQRNHRCAEGCASSDPDSHILKGGDGWIQGYNCQVAVDRDQSASGRQAAQTVTRSGTTEARWPRDLDARGRMDRKIRSKAGQAIDALRKIIAEPMFGQIKAIRGLDRFLLWGTEHLR
jgi:hypothetical protein